MVNLSYFFPMLIIMPLPCAHSRDHSLPPHNTSQDDKKAGSLPKAVPSAAKVTFVVYNMMGQRVKTLVDEEVGAGSYVVTWDGTNANGDAVSSGVYFYRVVAGENTVTQKMMLAS